MTAKVTTAAKPAKPAKPAAPKKATTTARKSSKASKPASSKASAAAAAKAHQAHLKHVAHEEHEAHLQAIGKAPKALARAGEYLPVCAFEAVAMSLRLAGQFVHDDEVGELWALAGSPPLGASLAAALDTAGLHGLAGFRPQWARVVPCQDAYLADGVLLPVAKDEAVPFGSLDEALAGPFHGLILGIDRPGPHAVLATDGGWWSWGELYDPWPCHVDQAWAVSWLPLAQPVPQRGHAVGGKVARLAPGPLAGRGDYEHEYQCQPPRNAEVDVQHAPILGAAA